MIKKIFFAIAILTGIVSLEAQAWNGTGHKAIAQIAQNHISSRTAGKLKEILGSKTIVSIASDADTYYYTWTRDIGWQCDNAQILRRDVDKTEDSGLDKEPTNIEPWCHSFTVDSVGVCYRHNREGDHYIRNAVMDIDLLMNELKTGMDKMTSDEKYRKIALVVHLIGDFHCPFHTLYVPWDPDGGKYNIRYDGTKVNMHTFWDTDNFKHINSSWTYANYATEADNATMAEIAEITKGTVYDWGTRSARDVLPAHSLQTDVNVPANYSTSMKWLTMQQLRNAGYRLAKVLDWIFE